MRLDATTIAQVVRAVSSGDGVVDTSLAERRQMHERDRLAHEFAKGTISAEEFIEMTKIAPEPPQPKGTTIEAETAVKWLQDMARLVDAATPEQLAQLVATVYDRIEVRGTEFVRASLTPTALAHGLALALPEEISGRWRPRQDSNLRPSA
jgi:hypothetical protein